MARTVPLLALLAALAPAAAQPGTARPAGGDPAAGDSVRAQVAPAGPLGEPPGAAYALATTLLASGRTDEATALLEDLHRADPTSLPVWLKLKEAYVAARRHDDLLAHVDARIAREGPSVALLAERGTALHRAGRPDAAADAWADAVAVAPDAPQTYRDVANEVGALRLFAEAAAVLERGRQRLDDDGAFLFERAHLHGLAADYARSVDLYLRLLARDADYLPAVRARLTQMLSNEGAAPVFAAALDRATALDPLDRSLRELQAWLALERRDYDAALDAVRALDRLARERGETLVVFAEQAAAAGALDVARRALDEVLDRHADGPAALHARLAAARLAGHQSRAAREQAPGPTPHADAARAAYLAFLDRHGAAEPAPAAALALAELLRDVYRDYDGAEARLAEAASGRDAGVAARARLGLGETALQRGDLDAARRRFADVDETVRIGPLAEQARYELALLDFYEGFMFSALARAEALDENTAAEAANDAIALRVTLNEALDPTAVPGPDVDLTGDPLHVYARAALRQRRGLWAEALATLDSLDASFDGRAHALADESLYLRALVLDEAGEAAEAVATLDRLIERFPLSFVLDRALRLQARAFERALGDPAAAAERWDRLLRDAPGSPLAPEARAELRRLRSSV